MPDPVRTRVPTFEVHDPVRTLVPTFEVPDPVRTRVPTFEVPDPVRVGVVSCEERVVAELTEAVASLCGGSWAEEVRICASSLRDVVPDQQLAV